MSNGTGRNDGRVIDKSDRGVIEGRLIGFAIDSAALHPKHCAWLDKHVVPVLAGGGSIWITGFASRSGSAAHNRVLSKRRVSAVLAYLQRNVRRHVSYRIGSDYSVIDAAGIGERGAELSGQKDGTEDSFYRAVYVSAWHRPTPPPPRSTSKP
jgi:outer membrane protein OmpA-like peptidoglycan-associated protein